MFKVVVASATLSQHETFPQALRAMRECCRAEEERGEKLSERDLGFWGIRHIVGGVPVFMDYRNAEILGAELGILVKGEVVDGIVSEAAVKEVFLEVLGGRLRREGASA